MRLRAYHLEYAARGELTAAELVPFGLTTPTARIDFTALRALFTVYKNHNFVDATTHGTWKINRDPRDRSPNIEIAALCMGGSDVSVGHWGRFPFTRAHAWMMAALMARVATLKLIDTSETFDGSRYGFINAPIATLSTHAERALQTPSPDATQRPDFGYFLYSGDPDCRWDLAALDPADAPALLSAQSARLCAVGAAAWLRSRAHEIKRAGIHDFWGLDLDASAA